jgi:hypothetical protein
MAGADDIVWCHCWTKLPCHLNSENSLSRITVLVAEARHKREQVAGSGIIAEATNSGVTSLLP